MSKPDFIGLGAPKAATTWLFHQLSEVPGLHLPVQKELHFFCDWRFRESGLADYRALFDQEKVSGEISVNYLESDFSRERILEYCPDARLFAVIRNPVDLAYSLYWHLKRQNFHCGYTKPITFEDALERFETRIIGPCCQGTSLAKWFADLDSRRIHVFTLDDVKEDGEKTLAELVRFLLDTSSVGDVTINAGITDGRKAQVLKPRYEKLYPIAYKFANEWGYRPLKRLIGEHSADGLKERLKVRQRLSAWFFGGTPVPMRQETRDRLTKRFCAEVSTLERLLGRDLSSWVITK